MEHLLHFLDRADELIEEEEFGDAQYNLNVFFELVFCGPAISAETRARARGLQERIHHASGHPAAFCAEDD